ncbi:MAG TPA: PKD domain-containing protein, partial [Solirubrobacteraceae bacterium]
EAASRPAGALSFAPRLPATPAGVAAKAPRVAVGPRGEVTLAYRRFDGTSYVVERTGRPLGATAFTAPAPLSATGENAGEPDLALDAQGDVTIAWERAGVVQAETLDAGGPLLDALTVPESAVPGEPVTMSVDARDARSSVAPPSWRFGDGTGAEGATVTHVYETAGTFRVRVTATDADGNSATETRTIAVRAPDPQPGGDAAGGAADRTKPALRRVRLSRRRVRPAARGGLLAPRRPARRRGTTLSLEASEAGTLKLAIERVRRRRVRTVATTTTSVEQGRVLRFLSGRSARRALPRGRYRLRVVLTDAAGNASTPAVVRFIVKGAGGRTRARR